MPNRAILHQKQGRFAPFAAGFAGPEAPIDPAPDFP